MNKTTPEQNKTSYQKKLQLEKDEKERRYWALRCEFSYADDAVSELI